MAAAAFPAGPAAFGKRGVLALVAIGTLAFLALLYFIGTDRMGGSVNNGQAHAASTGLTGFAALVRLLEAEGRQVSISRSEAVLDEAALLVLTPPPYANGEEIADLIERRADHGPTLVIMPKWFTDRAGGEKAKPGWVSLNGAMPPLWELIVDEEKVGLRLSESKRPERRLWRSEGGLRGELPAGTAIGFLDRDAALGSEPLLTSRGRVLVAQFDQGLGGQSELGTVDSESGYDRWYAASQEAWRVTVVAEPDLMNNWGMADAARARAALEILDAATGGQNLPIVFDLTTNGLGQSRNLLTLAFEPPFLAATLCLLVALLLVGWRAFRRFGPPLAEEQALSFGKAQLVENGGGLIQRTGRMHLLTRPYAALVENRLARKLGVRSGSRSVLDAALVRRGLDPVSPRLETLESARNTRDILRAARALHSLERTIAR